jgi:hypothetical protein
MQNQLIDRAPTPQATPHRHDATPLSDAFHKIVDAYRAGRKPRKPAPAYVTISDGSVVRVKAVLSAAQSIAKLARNDGHGYRTVGITLLPHTLGSETTLCPHASPDCIAGCLNLSGRTMAQTVQTDIIMRSRLARTILWNTQRERFLEMLAYELGRERATAQRRGETLIVRGNLVSDIDWAGKHRPIVELFPDVLWYGYTKNPLAFERWASGQYPSNYHLVFSRSERNEDRALAFLARGLNVSVIFDAVYSSQSKKPFPATWKGYRVIDGDETDLRFLDPRGVVVGLRAKGRLRQPSFAHHGFVIRTDRDPVNPTVID